ncbi:related to Vault poly [Fusarium fujikuroi]|nr:related to Vault poly [Fusarium fujikuroi]
MATRHVFHRPLKSGVIFSAPYDMPEEGWGDDTPIPRPKRRRNDIASCRYNQFSSWTANMAPFQAAHVGLASFALAEEAREYEASTALYTEPTKRLREPETPQVTLCLPILSVSVTATVDGTIARTELLQRFHNPSDITIDAAKHVFPLYDGAVITSFECTIGDERRVRGVVKPKVQARKEFDEAVRDKVAAPALLEEHTPEIFETSLGSIPTDTTVEIKITYVQELKVVMMKLEATEGIALTIPMSIAPRYSKAPIEWEPAPKVPEEKLDIWIKVADNGKVNHEGCDEESGHLLQFEGSKPVEYSNFLEKDASSKTYYVWHHVSEPAILRKDFVFVIQMKEGHHIKSRSIARPADDNGFAAVTVNIRPNDLFRDAIIPQSFTGEILFLLDQSGSMEWSNGSPDYGRRHTGSRKIDVMREAMLLALSGIPSTCVFNIISWGSATMGLWETSRPHTQENIREAKGYVSQVEADMGGTDLLRALESVVKRRAQDRGSTQIIILTDGELEPEDSIQFIWKKRQLFGDSIRFFALGIGDEVSHRLVESIAECGGGYSDVVHTTQTPRWHDRLNRLLKSALEPNSWSCDIDLGSQFERKGLTDLKLRDEKALESGKTPYIQAPFPISSLHPFSFASISFLIDLRHGGELPKTVTISTTTAGAKKKTYELAVEASSGSDDTIHRLVAKSVLLDLQDQIKRGTAETKIAKENAENIGTMYSITSQWTGFVAISENQPTQTVEEQKMNHYKALLDEIDIDELLNNVDDDESSTSGSSGFSGYGTRQSPGLNVLDAPLPFDHPMVPGNPMMTGRVLESAIGIPIPAPTTAQCIPPPPIVSIQPNCAGNRSRPYPRKLSFPKDAIEQYRFSSARRFGEFPSGDASNNGETLVFQLPNAVENTSPSRPPNADEDGRIVEPSNSRPFPPSQAPEMPRKRSRRPFAAANPYKEAAKKSIASEPMISPRHDRRIATLTTFIEPEEPQVSNDSTKSRLKGRLDRPSSTGSSDPGEFVFGKTSKKSTIKERTSVPAGTSDSIVQHSVSGPPSSMPQDSEIFLLSVPDSPGTHRDRSLSTLSQLAEYSSPGRVPWKEEESHLGSPEYPTYRAHPIPKPGNYQHGGSGAPDGDGNGNGTMSATYIPADNVNGLEPPPVIQYLPWTAFSSISGRHSPEGNTQTLGLLRSLPSRMKVYSSLDWQFAMECQDGQGLFDLGEKRPSLHLHFCIETATNIGPQISELLHNSSTAAEESDDIFARLLDTLMMIECYKTHRAQEEDTWDLMMERAWDAVISVLGLSEEEEALDQLAGQLRGAMMHAHYIAATGVKESEKDEDTAGTTRCPACDVIWRTTRQFFCPFDHESDGVDEFSRWDDFWRHQVDEGHVVCAQEVI